MNLNLLAEQLGLVCLTPGIALDGARDVVSGHASDLLSDILANAPAGSVVVTIQVHMNVIAVCVHAGVSAVIFAFGRTPDENVRKKAVEEGLPLFVSDKTTFDVVGRLYSLGLRGSDETLSEQ